MNRLLKKYIEHFDTINAADYQTMDINNLDNDNSEPLKWSDFIVVVVYFLMIIITGLIVSYLKC